MIRSYLGGANLSGANLCGADLSAANMDDSAEQEQTVLKLARFDEFTKWPDGFDPIAAGAVLTSRNS
jgi:uncharacterized protein YjbI with pentapeptide repeats